MTEESTQYVQNKPKTGSSRQKISYTINKNPNSSPNQPKAEITRELILARFIRICSLALASPKNKESAAIIVNRLGELTYIDRAVIVSLHSKEAIFAISGGGTIVQESHFADAVEAVRKRYGDYQQPALIPPATEDDVHLYRVQQAMGGTNILWVPLWLKNDPSVSPQYALWLERWKGSAWDEADFEILQRAALFFGHALLSAGRKKLNSRQRLNKLAAFVVMLVCFLFPIKSTVTAPAKVVPDQPLYVFAPMDGILQELYVQPGNSVKANQPLFRYDSRVMDKRLDEAARSVAVARAKLVKLEGAAHRDPEARAEIPIQRLEVERALADVEFYSEQSRRAEVRAPKEGIVVLDDPESLIGSALQTGQAVLSLADPTRTRLNITIPASDIGFLQAGAQVAARLDSDPLRSIPASITRIGFEVVLSENQVPSVNSEAIWLGKPPSVQPGQRATVKAFGKTTTLGMQLLRKPFLTFRNLIGF